MAHFFILVFIANLVFFDMASEKCSQIWVQIDGTPCISKSCPFNHQINLFLSQQFILLMRSLGFKQTLKVIMDYPAIFLMPGFAFWTFSGIKVHEPCFVCKKTRRIAVSFRMTLVNIILTMCVTSGCIYFCAEKLPVVLILFVLSLLLMGLVVSMESFGFCSCSCCSESCLPMTQRTSNCLNDECDLVLYFKE